MENSEAKIIDLVNRLTLEKKEIECYRNETFLNLKRKLRAEINVDERRIQFYDEKSSILNNNDIVHDLQRIQYVVDSSVNQQITSVIIEIRNNHFKTPKWVQVNSNDTVKHLKNEISKNDLQDLKTFLFDTNGVMLDDNKTIESYNLINGSKIKVWRGPNLLVTMKFYFYLNNFGKIPNSSNLQFSMTDSIRDVKKRISEIISPGISMNLALITDSSYWQNDKLLIDYPIKQEGTEVNVVDLQMPRKFTVGNMIKKGKRARQFQAKGDFDRELILYKYEMDDKSINENKILKYEIITRTFLSRSSVLRFAELITMFEDSNYFYIAIENTGKGSLKTLYLESPLPENDIIYYSIQISEALDYMHSNKFLHRNLRCSSVLVGHDKKIKLTNFHLSKYLFYCTTEQLIDGISNSRISSGRCWMAPEVLRNDPYGLKADIWSLGATVLEMLTQKRPYSKTNVVLATQNIIDNNAIIYEKVGLSESLTDIIDRCLHSCQWERPSANQCIQLFKCIAD